jgi:hypothetical protein
MRNCWLGLALALVTMASAEPARAQYLMSPQAPTAPASEPMPIGVSGAPQGPFIPPAGSAGGSDCSANVLPDDLPNASSPAPMPCDHTKWFVSFAWLHWWTKNDTLRNTLITTDTAPDLGTDFGAFGQPNTAILAGGAGLHQGPMNGIRGTFGVAPECFVPVEITGWWAHARKNTTFTSTSTTDPTGSVPVGSPELGRAVFSLDPAVFTESVYLASFPGLAFGQVGILSYTNFFGGDINFYALHLCGGVDQHGPIVDLTCGARFGGLNEGLDIFNRITAVSDVLPVSFLGAPFGTGNTTASVDSWRTRNQFYGGMIGLRTCYSLSCLNVELKADFGAGMNEEVLSVWGTSYHFFPPVGVQPIQNTPPAVAFGGVQAVPSNSGQFKKRRFSTLSDLGITLEVPCCDWLALAVGYDFMLWTQVARPGAQLSRFIDTRQVPTDIGFVPGFVATSPPPVFNQSNFYAHGLTLSLSFNY